MERFVLYRSYSRVIASFVLLLSMASGRPVNTISRFVWMGCEQPGGPGQVSTPV